MFIVSKRSPCNLSVTKTSENSNFDLITLTLFLGPEMWLIVSWIESHLKLMWLIFWLSIRNGTLHSCLFDTWLLWNFYQEVGNWFKFSLTCLQFIFFLEIEEAVQTFSFMHLSYYPFIPYNVVLFTLFFSTIPYHLEDFMSVA